MAKWLWVGPLTPAISYRLCLQGAKALFVSRDDGAASIILLSPLEYHH